MRQIWINITDTSFGIWQDDARDPTFEREIYGGVIRYLRDAGWVIGEDPRIKRHYTCLSRSHRIGRRDALHMALECAGRVVKWEVWAETWAKDNQNGHRHDFDKYRRLDYLDRLRLDLAHRKLIAWLGERCEITKIDDRDSRSDWPRFGRLTAWEAVERRCKVGPSTYRLTERERTTKDGHALTDCDRVYLLDRKGRWISGHAYQCGGNTWLVVTGPWTLQNDGAWSLWRNPPANPRAKSNGRDRRGKLERLLTEAMTKLDFDRAATLRRILFGDATLYRIRKDGGSYYAPNCSGYSSSLIGAGLYLRAEAETETRGHKELTMCAVDGTPVAAIEVPA